jgi:AcrR family transcriptional regulator
MDKVGKKQKKQARAIETQQKLIEAARVLFRERGYLETTTRHISERAGVSIGSFYVYYQDKKALFQDLIEEYYRELGTIGLSTLLTQAQNPDNRKAVLKTLIYNVKTFSDSMGEFYESLNQISHHDQDIQDSILHFEERIILSIKETIAGLSSIKPSKDQTAQAYLLYSLLDLNIHRFRRPLPKVTIDQVVEEMSDWIAQLLFDN